MNRKHAAPSWMSGLALVSCLVLATLYKGKPRWLVFVWECRTSHLIAVTNAPVYLYT